MTLSEIIPAVQDPALVPGLFVTVVLIAVVFFLIERRKRRGR